MQYATPQGLTARYGAHEIAQRATLDTRVTAELFELTVSGGDRSSYTADETTAADAALAHVQGRCDDANALVDSHLAALALTTVPKVLTPIACDIARYLLYDDAAPEAVTARYQNALKFLSRVAKGELSLGVTAADGTPAHDDTAHIESDGRVFARNQRGFI